MSSAALATARPGVVRGEAPERPDRDEPWLVRTAHALRGRVTVPRRATRAAIEAYARSVDAAGDGIETLSEASFDAAVADLRRQLHRRGLSADLLPRGLALVREAARRTLGTPHYDVQLEGGRVMLEGGLAELETGEGKTLTATLPASLAGLAGIPVHVITANDYLVGRDAERMAPIYERLGLRVGAARESEPERVVRKQAYDCDVTYVTHKQVAFDYLQDHTARAGPTGLAGRFEPTPTGETVLRGLCFAIVDEADSVLIDDARTPLLLSRPGPEVDEATVRAALFLANQLERGADFRIDRGRRHVELSDDGRERLEGLAGSLEGPLALRRIREAWVERALSATWLFERDRHYVVHEGAVQIIDLPTGRRAPDRSFEGGIHALIEAREGVAITPGRETVARISYQRFFRRYLRLAGMTGTASEVAQELWTVYGLPTVAIPTRLPSQRRNHGMRLLPDEERKWQAVVARVDALHRQQRPVLVGTCSVGSSETLSARLTAAGLSHQVLNALQDGDEAALVARAGEAGRITVATRMAGRGTDIGLGPGVAERGGLAVIGTELGETLRIDRQLFGRSARQGAPGSCEQIVSLDDALLLARLPQWIHLALRAGFVPGGLRFRFTRWVRRAEESRGARVRRRMLESEKRLAQLLAFSGRGE